MNMWQCQVRTHTGATCKGVLQTKATFIDVKISVSPPGLKPDLLEYHSNALNMFHIKVANVHNITSIPCTPLPHYFLLVNVIKASNKL